MDISVVDCPALGAGSSAKDGRGQSGWLLVKMPIFTKYVKNTAGFHGNIIIQGKLLLQPFLEAIPKNPNKLQSWPQ